MAQNESTLRGNEARATGATLLTGAGLLAGFAAASCCAVPLGLAMVGLGSAWLVPLALITVRYQLYLVLLAAVCLIAGAVLLRQREKAVCATKAFCDHPAVRAATIVALGLGAVFVVLGYVFVD